MLILVDYNLADMVGEEVLSKIKANGGFYRKAILMSGDNNLKGQFESKGFNFFLHKPVTIIFQITRQTTFGPIDLKQFGIEQNYSASPITGTEDYSKYFKTTKITTTNRSGPMEVSLDTTAGQKKQQLPLQQQKQPI